MNTPLNADEVLVPLMVATGAGNSQVAMMMLAYRGVSVIKQGQGLFLSLAVAIRWNKAEAADASSRTEGLYRTALAEHLESRASSGESLVYTPELWALWAKVFEDDARMLVKTSRTDVPEETREIIRNALK